MMKNDRTATKAREGIERVASSSEDAMGKVDVTDGSDKLESSVVSPCRRYDHRTENVRLCAEIEHAISRKGEISRMKNLLAQREHFCTIGTTPPSLSRF